MSSLKSETNFFLGIKRAKILIKKYLSLQFFLRKTPPKK